MEDNIISSETSELNINVLGDTATTDTVENKEEKEQVSEKVFTQTELDKIIEKRLIKERNKAENDPDAKAFKNWKENQKTEQEKLQSQLLEAEAVMKENTNLKNMNMILTKGIDSNNIDYALFLSEKMASTDKTLGFEEALDKVIEENEHIFKPKKEVKTATVNTGVPHVSQEKTTKYTIPKLI